MRGSHLRQTWLALLLLSTLGLVGATSVDKKVRLAQEKLKKAFTYNHIVQAEKILAGAVSTCESSSDPSCPEAYAWLGIIIEHQHHTDGQILRDRVAPLYAKAMERSGEHPSALILELRGHSLARLGDTVPSKELLDRAAALRRAATGEIANSPGVDSAPTKRGPEGITPPILVRRVEPTFPRAAQLLRQEGSVILTIVVGRDGAPHSVRLTKGLGFGLDEEALRAIREWRFTPGMIDGRPVNVEAKIEMNFRLQ